MFCVYYVVWTESLGVSGRAGANHNAQWHPEFLFFSECCLCISANLILYFIYVNQKLSCKMGSNEVFLNLNFEFEIWGQIEPVFNISKFSKWPPFWAREKLFYRKENIPERYPWAFPTFWAFDRRCNSNIDGDISISKFDLFCDLVTSSMTSWICIHTIVVIVWWYICTGSLMMISLLVV